MHSLISNIVRESGLWSDGREQSHGFILSPSVYNVSAAQRLELEAIGRALHTCMKGLGHIAVEVSNPKKSGNHTYGLFAKALRTGVPKAYHTLMLERPEATPHICKVDLVLTEAGFRIVEVDGHNKRGLGYCTLVSRMREAMSHGMAAFSGAATAFAEELTVRGVSYAALLYGVRERFYYPEFLILKDELRRFGVELLVVGEGEVRLDGERVVVPDGRVTPRVFVDLPFMYENGALHELLGRLYRNGEIEFLIPPKPFLSSKALLALLRNESGNVEAEALLRSHIEPASLELVRRYIPETHLVHSPKREKEPEKRWREISCRKAYVLKQVISGGMKGIVFRDETERWEKEFSLACRADCSYVLQEEVTNVAWELEHFGCDGSLQRQGGWFLRLIAYCTQTGIADLLVTARKDKKVHGASDCLFFGAVIGE